MNKNQKIHRNNGVHGECFLFFMNSMCEATVGLALEFVLHEESPWGVLIPAGTPSITQGFAGWKADAPSSPFPLDRGRQKASSHTGKMWVWMWSSVREQAGGPSRPRFADFKKNSFLVGINHSGEIFILPYIFSFVFLGDNVHDDCLDNKLHGELLGVVTVDNKTGKSWKQWI